MAKLDKPLELANILIKKYDPSKLRPVQTGDHTTLSISKFTSLLVTGLKKDAWSFPEITKCINNVPEMESLLEEWAVENCQETGGGGVVPEDLSDLILNVDMSSSRRESRYFCTTPDELVETKVSGEYYIDKCGLDMKQAINTARAVVPRYMPRSSLGVHTKADPTTQRKINFYNTYVPAAWAIWKKKNLEEWNKLPAKCPGNILEMIKHMVPLKEERSYLYAWVYTSITTRAYVYLILNGIPGLGKNLLHSVIGSLHGKANHVNGKKETFGANGSKFNGQLFNSTFASFDELKYDRDLEPRLKEYQNDSASKELKGIDATGSSDLFCSMAISNNYPRDNYIPFDSRKFCPIVMGNTKLKDLMSLEDISEIAKKVDESDAAFDVKFVAQFAKWILKIGPDHAAKFNRLEYQGPKFWELAHASMSRWQKVVVVALTTRNTRGYFPGWHETKKAFQWTEVEAALRRKKDLSDKDYRDPSTVKAFFDNYRDTEGKKAFETKAFTGSILQDFWVWPLHGVEKVLGDVTVEMEDGESIKISEAGPLERPKGTSDYLWQKMKLEYAKSKKVETDNDLL